MVVGREIGVAGRRGRGDFGGEGGVAGRRGRGDIEGKGGGGEEGTWSYLGGRERGRGGSQERDFGEATSSSIMN